MEIEMQQKLDAHEQKLDAIFASVEKTKKYLQLITWITIATVILPIIGLMIIVPMVLNSYAKSLEGLL